MHGLNEMKFCQCCQFVVFAVFAAFGCTGFYPSGQFRIRRSRACRVYGLALLVTFSAYYFRRFDKSKEFYLKSKDALNLVYFEFNFYWFASSFAFLATILNGGKVAAWFQRVTEELAAHRETGKFWIFAGPALNCILDSVIIAVFCWISFSSRSQPDLSTEAAVLYVVLCEISAVTVLQIMSGKLFLAHLLNRLRFELSETLRAPIRSRASVAKKLREIMSKHHDYSMLEINFNDLFSVQILLFTALAFVELTYSMYYLLSPRGLGKLYTSADQRFVFSCSYFGVYFFQFLQYTVPYELVQDRFQQIQNTINSKLSEIDDADDRIQEIMEALLIQCQNLNSHGMAGGVLKIGHVLIGKMFGIVSSTLVILFQFEDFSSGGDRGS